MLSQDLDDKQKEGLKGFVDGCSNVLKELDKKLDKYGELKPIELNPGELKSGESKLHLGTGRRGVKRFWKRLKWDPEDFKGIQTRITAHITFLNNFQGRINK